MCDPCRKKYTEMVKVQAAQQEHVIAVCIFLYDFIYATYTDK